MFSLLNPGRWILYAALCAALAGGYAYWAHHEREAGAAPYIAQLGAMRAAADKAQAQNLQIQQALQQKVTEAQNEAHKRAEVLQANADAAAATAHSLRDQLAAVRSQLPALSRAAITEYAATAGELLGDCAKAYTDMAAKAEGHASDALMMLDAWPRQ